MVTKHIDPVVHRALVQAISECILTGASSQISFIAAYIDTLCMESARPNQIHSVHEDHHTSTNWWLESLCSAMEACQTSPDSYRTGIMESLRHVKLASTSCSSHPEMQHFTPLCGSSSLDLPLNISCTPEPVVRLVKTIVHHLNHLTV